MVLNIDDNLALFLDALPLRVRMSLDAHDLTNLLEVIVDLGRLPEARFVNQTIDIGDYLVDELMLSEVAAKLVFGENNRAGIAGTLHRISCIRDRTKTIVGLTCRVGRAVYGTSKIIEDVLRSGKSVLLLGKPGIGKTTKLRDAARMLSTDLTKRVVIVDTSNEIAGDGSIPHPAIGRSRRMQVPSMSKQHYTMIEAVQNHMPEVIVIDEIGHANDVAAARTIAERGVQLIGTAHGLSLLSIIDNPTLTDLVGGMQAVVLGDQQAQAKGTKKTILERKHNPTFDIAVEIIDINTVAIHYDVAATIDLLLSGGTPLPEIRKVEDDGSISVTRPTQQVPQPEGGDELGSIEDEIVERHKSGHRLRSTSANRVGPATVYAYALTRSKVVAALEELGLDALVVDSAQNADMILVLGKKEANVRAYRKRAKIVIVPSDATFQITQALKQSFQIRS